MILRRLAWWARMPGHDYDKPWASWMLNSESRPAKALYWIFEKVIERFFCWLACAVSGHQPINDHCGNPAHRYCNVCGKRTPHAEVGQ